MWKEKDHIGERHSIYIPTQHIDLNPPSIVVRTKCETEVEVGYMITLRIVDALKVVDYTQPIEYMRTQLSSITENIIGDYNYTDLQTMKEDIQEKIVSEFSHEGQRLGIVCDKFIIKY